MGSDDIPEVSSLAELYQLASDGDEHYQRLCVAALESLSGNKVAVTKKKKLKWKVEGQPKWKAYYSGLIEHVRFLVQEMGELDEFAAKVILAKVNGVRGDVGVVNLEWEV